MTAAGDDRFILGRQVELLFRNLRLGQITSIVNAGFLTWIAWDQVASAALLAWLFMACAVAGLRMLGGTRYFRCEEETRQKEAADWHRLAVIGAGASGIIWAAGALLLMSGSDTTLQLFTAFIMAGMVAGAVPVLAADRSAFRRYAWPIVLAVAIGSLGKDPLHVAFTTMTLLFMVIATRSADYFNQTLHDTFRLEHEKDDLLEHLAAAHRQTEQSARMKTQFLANVSHELRTPMNGIIGLADLLEQEALSDGQRELLTPLRQSADQLMHLIANLIELSALDAGQIRLKPAPFAVNELLTGLVYNHRKAAEAKGLRFEETVSTDLPPTLGGDVERLRQVFRHLLENAIKFTHSGHIAVSAEVVSRHDDIVRLRFSVNDTGIGIAPEVIPQLNGLMVQADGSSIRRHGGIGLGLPIARKLIELMGGQLSIASTPGRGSCFSFEIDFPVIGDDLFALTADHP